MDLDETHMKIVRHLSLRRRNSNAFEGHPEHTQPQVALAVDRARSLCSRKLSELMDAGYVFCEQLHVGNSRRRNVYYLTHEGFRLIEHP